MIPVKKRHRNRKHRNLEDSITNPDMDCIKLEVATFKFGDQMTGG